MINYIIAGLVCVFIMMAIHTFVVYWYQPLNLITHFTLLICVIVVGIMALVGKNDILPPSKDGGI